MRVLEFVHGRIPLNTLYLSFWWLFLFLPCDAACVVLVPWPGIEHVPLWRKHGVLTTRTTGKSHLVTLTIIIFLSLEFAQGQGSCLCLQAPVLTYAQILSKYEIIQWHITNIISGNVLYFESYFTSSFESPLKIDTAICQFVFHQSFLQVHCYFFHLDLIFPSFKVWFILGALFCEFPCHPFSAVFLLRTRFGWSTLRAPSQLNFGWWSGILTWKKLMQCKVAVGLWAAPGVPLCSCVPSVLRQGDRTRAEEWSRSPSRNEKP